MITIRKSKDRGHAKHGWIESFHTFSFAEYHDSNFMNFGSLRVINEDFIKAQQGFGKHSHRNMEIITYVIKGELEHKDSMGTGSIIRPGEIQRMSAGKGVYHSESNHSATETLHLLQIWITPQQTNLEPSYEQKTINKTENQLNLIASPTETKNAVKIHQDVNLYVAYLTENKTIKHTFQTNHQGWLQLIKGKIKLNNQELSAGDGAVIMNENTIEIHSTSSSEFLLFDLLYTHQTSKHWNFNK